MAASEGLRFGWFIPTYGDSAGLGDTETWSPRGLELFRRVARTAEAAGFEYALVPVATECWEAWMASMAMALETTQLKLLVAARPGLVAPTLMAKMVSTFDQLTQGRIFINLIAGGGEAEMAADGIFWDHDQRYEVMAETVALMKRLWTADGPVTFTGEHVRVENAVVRPPTFQQPHPPFFLGGISPAAQRVGAEHADVYLYWADRPQVIAEDVAHVREVAAEFGRAETLRHGLRAHVCVRETEAEAWQAAHHVTAGVTEAMKERRERGLGAQSTADGRMRSLAAESEADDFRIAPHLWAGLTPVRHGAGVVIVGDPDQVAATIEEFIDAGCRDFCLSGWPHDEEAQRFGELVLPRFAGRLLREPSSAGGRPVASEEVRRSGVF